MPPTDPTVKYSQFSGINNRAEPERLAPDALRLAENVDITNAGTVARRDGYTLTRAGKYHSLASFNDGDTALVVDQTAGYLCRVNANITTSQLRQLSDPHSRISYAQAHDSIFFTNGYDTGRIDGNGAIHSWPHRRPALAPSITVLNVGGMKAGYYSVAVTYFFFNVFDTTEIYTERVLLPSDGGIQLSNIPSSTDPDVPYTNIYCTNASGEPFVSSYNSCQRDSTRCSLFASPASRVISFSIIPRAASQSNFSTRNHTAPSPPRRATGSRAGRGSTWFRRHGTPSRCAESSAGAANLAAPLRAHWTV